MEPYWRYEDVRAAFFFRPCLCECRPPSRGPAACAALIRAGAFSLALQSLIILLLGIALYAIGGFVWCLEPHQCSCLHACGMQSDPVPGCQTLIREHARAIAVKFIPKAWM